MKLKTHICLISDQPLPNLIPALDPGLRPSRVIQVVSRAMQQRADDMAVVLKVRGVHVEQWPIADPWDVEHAKTRLLQLLEREKAQIPDKQIGLNVTGGAKPMSIGAYEACRAYELPIFYVHPEKDRLVWIYSPGGSEIPPVELADRIRIEPFLQAHGVEVRNQPGRNVVNPSLLQTGEEIIRCIDTYHRQLGTLNYLASKAEKTLSTPLEQGQRRKASDLIELFQSHDLLEDTEADLRFSNEDARFFANGGWLEYTVFDAVRQLRKQDQHIQDVARGVRVSRRQENKSIPNELDVVFLRNNRLHIIECKTRQFRGEGEDAPGAEALYKLDTLADLMGGLQARAMLVSFRDISGYDRARAADLGISICSGQQLQNLKSHLRQFIDAR